MSCASTRLFFIVAFSRYFIPSSSELPAWAGEGAERRRRAVCYVSFAPEGRSKPSILLHFGGGDAAELPGSSSAIY